MAIGVIIKKIKAQARSIRATFSYILNINGRGRKGHKVQYSGAENFLSDRLEKQIQEMTERHIEYKKYGGKVTPDMHLVLSYPSDFIMSKEEYRKDVKAVLKHLGMENHSCLWAVHTNTKKTHIHLYIDRINPVSLEFDSSRGTCFEKTKCGTIRRHESNCFQAACCEISKKRGYSISQYLVDEKGQAKEYVVSRQIRVNTKDTVAYEFALEVNNLINDFLKLENKSWGLFLSMLAESEIDYKTIASKTGSTRGAVFIDRETENKLKSSNLPIGHKQLEQELGAFPLMPRPTLEKPAKKKKIINTDFKEEVKAKIKNMIEKSNSWLELQNLIENEGYFMEQRGTSFTFICAVDDVNTINISPSKIDRTISLVKLKQRWGNPPAGIIKPFKKEPREIKIVQKYDRFGYHEDKKHEIEFSLTQRWGANKTPENHEALRVLQSSILSYHESKLSKTTTIEFVGGYTLKETSTKILLESYKNEQELHDAIHSVILLGIAKGWQLEDMVFNGSDFFTEKAYGVLNEIINNENKVVTGMFIKDELADNEEKVRVYESFEDAKNNNFGENNDIENPLNIEF